MRLRSDLPKLTVILAIVFVMLACSFPGGSAPADTGLEGTRIALSVQATGLANQATELALKAQAAATQPPPVALAVVATQAPLPTYTPYPTQTPLATNAPAPTDVQPGPAPTQDVMTRIQTAKILLFEDIQGYPALDTRISKALTGLGLTGGNVVKVGDAVGDFMTNLNSATKWDLIIVGAEARSGVRGEFWDLINEQVNRNVAVVVEIWYLDQIANGRISPLLMRCGIQFQRNWTRAPGYDLYNYSIYWLDQFNPIFSDPNVVQPLLGPTIYWTNDAGDIIKLAPGSNATLLAGITPSQKTSNGVLASCLNGRLIFQTFSTHDYQESATVALWQNYIVNSLKAHFAVTQ